MEATQKKSITKAVIEQIQAGEINPHDIADNLGVNIKTVFGIASLYNRGIIKLVDGKIIREKTERRNVATGQATEQTEEQPQLQIAKISIKRNGGLFLEAWVCPEIEEFFKNGATIRESQNWSNNAEEPLKFYVRQISLRSTNDIGRFFASYHDNYGESFIYDGRPNIAVFRTVGISQNPITLKLDNSYSEETLVDAVSKLKTFIKEAYVKYIRKITIKCTLEITEV